MNRIFKTRDHRAAGWMLLLTCCWLVATPAAAVAQDLPKVSQADFPSDDAVVLRQLQDWTLNDDGSIVYEEHRWVLLLNDRAWRRHADPRVDFRLGLEEVELLAARAHLPDGTKLDSPDYAINVVTPAGLNKWPATADWREVVYTFSGVQNGAVLELHYKRTSQPGVRRWLSADLRIGDIDPVIARVVRVTLPSDRKLSHQLDRADKYAEFAEKKTQRGMAYRWQFANVPSEADEPRCPPWQERCGRLRFTSCPSASQWTADLQAAIEGASETTERIKEFALAATKEEVNDTAKIRSISKKIRDTFNVVTDDRAWIGRKMRSSDDIFDSCYGSRLEAAALTLAALRSAGLEAQPRLAVESDTFAAAAPTDESLAGVMVEVQTADGTILLDPTAGIVDTNGEWGRRNLLHTSAGKLQTVALASESSRNDAVVIGGQLTLAEDGESLTGDVTVELTGLFVEPEKLLSEKDKKSRIKRITGQVLTGLKVTDFSVSHLAEDRFVAHATVEASKAPQEVHGRRMISIAVDTPALAEAHLPLDASFRRTPVQLTGHLAADVRLTIKLPDGWTPVILPETLPAVSGDWGRISQMVKTDENGVHLARQVRFDRMVIGPDVFAEIRRAVRTLRSDAARSLLVAKTEKSES